jgi:site-specific DNA-methyltransferase (adenine-specific)
MNDKRIVWSIAKKKISELTPYDKNPRIITEAGLNQLKESFDEIGMAQPVNINTDGTILSGHARIMQLKNEGTEEVDVMIPDRKLTPKQEEAVIIRMNKNVAGVWDFDILKDSFQVDDLIDWGFDESELGWIASKEQDGKRDDESVPTLGNLPITQRGDVWLLGDHRLMCGDSTLIDDVEKLMNREKASLVHTDPPYNIDYQGGSKKREKIANDKLEDFGEFLEMVYTNLNMIMWPGACIYVWHASAETHRFIQKFLEAGFLYKSYIVWNKNNSTFGRSDYHWKHEPAIYGWKEGGAHKWFGDRKQTTVWDIERPSRSDQHPTMKPVELCERAISNSSGPGAIVVDVFLGSGSTLIACEKTGRRCFGLELSEKYCDTTIKRWEEYTGKKAILELTGQTYEELLIARK